MLAFWGLNFFICNGFIAVFIFLLLLLKRILNNYISNQIQYKIWFLLFALLIVPFLPFNIFNPISTLIKNKIFQSKSIKVPDSGFSSSIKSIPMSLNNDFSISVEGKTQFQIGLFLFYIWLIGVVIMLFFSAISHVHIKKIQDSSLPLQNQKVNKLFHSCKEELNVKSNIPIYSTAFLKSPILIGFLHPKIYIPIYLISDFTTKDLRFILLHELQHYKRKDAIGNILMNIFSIVYWINPLIWYAFKEIKDEREIACDNCVLNKLDEKECKSYGYTLIHFSEKASYAPFLHFTSIGGNTKQIKKRIIKIAAFQPDSFLKKIRSYSIFLLLSIFVLEYSTFLPAFGKEQDLSASIDSIKSNIAYEDLSPFFKDKEGSFVLYNLNTDSWTIYNKPMALKRVSPNSTYKIYSGLFSLESRLITPLETSIKWNGQTYPFSQWNKEQTLTTAIKNSVNWYFQALDKQLGLFSLKQYYEKINYGNCDLSGGLSNYWLESSLKISPLEQVQLLKDFYHNNFLFQPENIQAVKNAMKLSSSEKGTLYGKTGTGKVDYQATNGWFIGYVESKTNTFIFAVNIQDDSNANGIIASQIALDILKYKKIYTIK